MGGIYIMNANKSLTPAYGEVTVRLTDRTTGKVVREVTARNKLNGSIAPGATGAVHQGHRTRLDGVIYYRNTGIEKVIIHVKQKTAGAKYGK